MRGSEVLEFIIVPPYHRRDKVAASERPFKEYLSRQFRGYNFRVVGIAPVGAADDEDYQVIPIMNFIDPDGIVRMCEPPKRWLMSEIAEACKSFDRVH